jgi:hypothetical protein
MKIVAIENNHCCGREFWGLVGLPDELDLSEILKEYKGNGDDMFNFLISKDGKRLEYESINVNNFTFPKEEG